MSFTPRTIIFAATALSILSMPALAGDLGFKCATRDGKTALSAVYDSAALDSAALRGRAVLLQAGKRVEIGASQYKNIDGELFLYSLSDAQDPRGIPVSRIVRLDATLDERTGKGSGTLTVIQEFGGRMIDEIKVRVNCQAD
jgi:hypothetical protein